jgi:deoxyribose-phosphate aldolase
MASVTVLEVAAAMDHAVLKPDYTHEDLERNALMCISRGIGCLCVRSSDVKAAVKLLQGSSTVVARWALHKSAVWPGNAVTIFCMILCQNICNDL